MSPPELPQITCSLELPGYSVQRERVGDIYQTQLAELHHREWGRLARAGATELLTRLGAVGFREGTVVELGCGSGISCAAILRAGFDVWAIDQSASMVAHAREHAPQATIQQASVWDVSYPPCVGASAIGEVLGYRSASVVPDIAMVEDRFAAIYDALAPKGILLFDLAGPGRAGKSHERQVAWNTRDSFLWMKETEIENTLHRHIETFVEEGDSYRRSTEHHTLTLFSPESVTQALERCGFTVDLPDGYADLELLPGWHAFVASKA